MGRGIANMWDILLIVICGRGTGRWDSCAKARSGGSAMMSATGCGYKGGRPGCMSLRAICVSDG